MAEPITYVGIDAQTHQLHVAMLVEGNPAVAQWTCSTEPRAIERLRPTLEREAPGPIECCYEAGPNGYTLQRRLQRGRVRCRVIAPSLIPRQPGDHVKTDRRDARKLATLLRADLLTEVHAPTEAQEAVRDLCRVHDAVRVDLMRCRHRLSRLLVRRGHVYAGRAWTKRHGEWLQTLTWAYPADRHVVSDAQLAIAQLVTRQQEVERFLGELAIQPPYTAPVAALRCFRGIDTVTAITLVAELHDVRRFPRPRALMAVLGLVPREDSTGDRRRRGSITKMGNGLLRRLLVQAAWHYRHPPRPTAIMRRRRLGQPPALIAIADKAEQRLCRRYARLGARGKPTPVVVIALARELVGFLWATLHHPEAQM